MTYHLTYDISNFMGILAKIFGGKKKPTLVESAAKVISSYGKVLENNNHNPLNIYDIKQLPYDKDTIKNAFQVIFLTSDDQDFMRALAVGYTCLAYFQDGVGTNINMNITEEDLLIDPSVMADRFLKDSGDIDRFNAAIKEEEESLIDDLKEWGIVKK